MSEIELSGTNEVPIYLLRYHGGHRDGEVVNSFRPYDAIRDQDGTVYRARAEGDACLVWVDDFTRAIDLYLSEGE